jgi:hypothetical protein
VSWSFSPQSRKGAGVTIVPENLFDQISTLEFLLLQRLALQLLGGSEKGLAIVLLNLPFEVEVFVIENLKFLVLCHMLFNEFQITLFHWLLLSSLKEKGPFARLVRGLSSSLHKAGRVMSNPTPCLFTIHVFILSSRLGTCQQSIDFSRYFHLLQTLASSDPTRQIHANALFYKL